MKLGVISMIVLTILVGGAPAWGQFSPLVPEDSEIAKPTTPPTPQPEESGWLAVAVTVPIIAALVVAFAFLKRGKTIKT